MTNITALYDTVDLGRDDDLSAGLLNALHECIGVIAFVTHHRLRGQARDQILCQRDISHLASTEQKPQRVAQSIDRDVNLGAQAPARAAERLRAFFFWAPAACWWARTVMGRLPEDMREIVVRMYKAFPR